MAAHKQASLILLSLLVISLCKSSQAAGIAIYWAQNSNESPWLTIVLQGTTNM